MKKWRCTVCNYIHNGDNPPEKCPVCGADRSKFVEISAEEAKQYEEQQPAQKPFGPPEDSEGAAAAGSGYSKHSRHGKNPSSEVSGGAAVNKPSGFRDFVDQQLIVYHAHPVSVHVPNGVLPIVVLFMFVSAVLGTGSLAWAAFYFTVMVVISMPVVIYTGYNEWQRKYQGARTTLFSVKIAAAAVVAVSSLLLVLWFFIHPEVIYSGAARRGAFLLLNLVLLGATGVAGFIGGKLVFKD